MVARRKWEMPEIGHGCSAWKRRAITPRNAVSSRGNRVSRFIRDIPASLAISFIICARRRDQPLLHDKHFCRRTQSRLLPCYSSAEGFISKTWSRSRPETSSRTIRVRGIRACVWKTPAHLCPGACREQPDIFRYIECYVKSSRSSMIHF